VEEIVKSIESIVEFNLKYVWANAEDLSPEDIEKLIKETLKQIREAKQ